MVFCAPVWNEVLGQLQSLGRKHNGETGELEKALAAAPFLFENLKRGQGR